jgi:acyl-coenzyme A thioesterase PaaI-like protein
MTPEERVRASFARQGLLATLGARVTRVAPGEVDVELAFRRAAGAAARLPARGRGHRGPRQRLWLSRGRVVRAGRTLTVCRGDAITFAGDEERHVATMTATMMAVGSRGGQTG